MAAPNSFDPLWRNGPMGPGIFLYYSQIFVPTGPSQGPPLYRKGDPMPRRKRDSSPHPGLKDDNEIIEILTIVARFLN